MRNRHTDSLANWTRINPSIASISFTFPDARQSLSLSLFLSVNPRFFPVIKLVYARVGPIKLALNSIPNSKDTDDRCYLFANSAASKMPLDKCLTRLGAYGYSEYDITGEIAYSRVPIKT